MSATGRKKKDFFREENKRLNGLSLSGREKREKK